MVSARGSNTAAPRLVANQRRPSGDLHAAGWVNSGTAVDFIPLSAPKVR
jgi:hypothetical protein